jgi:hypothetical protein
VCAVYSGTAAANAQGQLLGNLIPSHAHDKMALRLASKSSGDAVPQNAEEAHKALAVAKDKRSEGGEYIHMSLEGGRALLKPPHSRNTAVRRGV